MRSFIFAVLFSFSGITLAVDLSDVVIDLNGVDLKGCPNFTIGQALSQATIRCDDGSTIGFFPEKNSDGGITAKLERHSEGAPTKCNDFNGKRFCDDGSVTEVPQEPTDKVTCDEFNGHRFCSDGSITELSRKAAVPNPEVPPQRRYCPSGNPWFVPQYAQLQSRWSLWFNVNLGGSYYRPPRQQVWQGHVPMQPTRPPVMGSGCLPGTPCITH